MMFVVFAFTEDYNNGDYDPPRTEEMYAEELSATSIDELYELMAEYKIKNEYISEKSYATAVFGEIYEIASQHEVYSFLIDTTEAMTSYEEELESRGEKRQCVLSREHYGRFFGDSPRTRLVYDSSTDSLKMEKW